MGVEAIPAILYTLLVLSIPKSPRWLYLNNQKDKAEKIIRDAYSKNDADELIIEIPFQYGYEEAYLHESMDAVKYLFPTSSWFKESLQIWLAKDLYKFKLSFGFI